MLIELVAISAAIYKGNKSLEMDEQASKKYSKAFTRESEARQLISKKRNLADKRLENVAKKKRAIISSSLPLFVEIYSQIQNETYDMIKYNDAEWSHTLQSVSLVTKKEFINQELIVGILFKSFSGMMVEDSKRNLSAANSQVRAANVLYAQAQSISDIYDAIIERADRISALLMSMNAMFAGVLSETQKIIMQNGTNVEKYTEKEKSTLVLCVNFAVAITNLLNIPILDNNGEIAESAIQMIQTGEEYL